MEIKIDQILLQVVNFGLLLFVLTKVLYKPITKVLEERTKKIKEGLEAAEKNIAEKEKIEDLKKKELFNAQKQAIEIIQEERKKATKQGQEIIEKARLEAKVATEREQKLLFERLKEEEKRLKSEVAKIATLTAQKIITKTLGESDQRKLIKKQITSLGKIKI